jgi:hypothetical protein
MIEALTPVMVEYVTLLTVESLTQVMMGSIILKMVESLTLVMMVSVTLIIVASLTLIMVVCYFEKWSVMEYKVHLFSFSELFEEKLVNLSLNKIVTNILYYIINIII